MLRAVTRTLASRASGFPEDDLGGRDAETSRRPESADHAPRHRRSDLPRTRAISRQSRGQQWDVGDSHQRRVWQRLLRIHIIDDAGPHTRGRRRRLIVGRVGCPAQLSLAQLWIFLEVFTLGAFVQCRGFDGQQVRWEDDSLSVDDDELTLKQSRGSFSHTAAPVNDSR